MKYTDKQLKALIEGVENGSITTDNLPEDLYFATADYLKKQLYKGFGLSDVDIFTKTDESLELVLNMRENIYVFSAAKTYHNVSDIIDCLIDPKTGIVRSTEKFVSEALKINDQYNKIWLEAEGITTIAQAQSAQRWQDITDRSDVLPILRYSTIGDACKICAPLDGLTAPYNWKGWAKIMPSNHYICFCIVEQYPEGEHEETQQKHRDALLNKATDLMNPVFISNSGMTGEVFNKHHAYFDIPNKDIEAAKNNFGLPIPRR